jgi:hypothetical protein
MASEVQRRRESLAALRKARREQRALDTALEKVERELLRLRSRKTLIEGDDVNKLIQLWDSGVRPQFNTTQMALSDFVGLARI